MSEGGLRAQFGGSPTDAPSFSTRHRLALVLLWAHVPVLAVFGMAVGAPLLEVVAASLALTFLGTVGTIARSPSAASGAVGLGLMTAAGILVFLSGGLLVANLYFLVMIVALSAYRAWRVLALGVVYVAVYQFGVNLDPPVPPDVDPVSWAVTNSAAALGTALLLVAAWRVDARSASVERGIAEQYRFAFAAAPALALLRPSGEVIEANPAMADLLGYDAMALAGTEIRSLVHSDDLSELGSAWEAMGNGKGDPVTAWMRCVTADGRTIWARISLTLVPWTPNRPAAVVLQLTDTSRARDTEMRLEDIIAGKDAFVAAIGDELRVPLGSVIDLTRLEEQAADPTLREIGARAREISSVVDDLVVSARFDTGTVTVVPRFVDSAAVCREILSSLPRAEIVTQELRPLSAWADPQLTKQILNGLVGNAIRFGGNNVVVRTVSSGPDTVIQVIDDGPEIPERDRHRIFSSDLNGGRPVTEPASVGLGLTVGRRLARKMDGDITYRRTKDHRNVFELRLPSERLSHVERPRRQDETMGLTA